MHRQQIAPVAGILTAMAITTLMDANDLSMFSALPLLPLGLLLWYWQRFSRLEMGLVWGRPNDYGLAVMYPLSVIGAATVTALLAGVVDVSATNWQRFWIELALGSTIFVPEVGLVGLALNSAYAALLWFWFLRLDRPIDRPA